MEGNAGYTFKADGQMFSVHTGYNRQEEAKWEKQAEEARQPVGDCARSVKFFRSVAAGNGPALWVPVVNDWRRKRVISAAARAKIGAKSEQAN